jgi:uncharacterized membrane protein YjgN (DUF898 family)
MQLYMVYLYLETAQFPEINCVMLLLVGNLLEYIKTPSSHHHHHVTVLRGLMLDVVFTDVYSSYLR